MRLRSFLSLLVFFLLAVPSISTGQDAAVEFFSPEGTVKGVRQTTVRFTEPMVALGDPRLADPLEANCPGEGQGRWIDAKNWSYDFEEDLPAGVVCEFRLKTGILTLAGKVLTGRSVFRFTTGGPAVKTSHPYQGSEAIDEGQIFVLIVDAPTQEESIAKHAYFSVAGIKERVGIRIVKGEERKKLLANVFFHTPAEESDNCEEDVCYRLYGTDTGDSRIVVLQAKQIFPASAVVKLVWAAGIASASGVATTEDQVLTFNTREPFTATFRCGRENPEVGCIPVLPMTLYFSAPVPTREAAQIVLRGKNGKVFRGKQRDDEDEDKGYTRMITFPGPFPEKTSYTLALPKGLHDDAGRSLSNSRQFPLAVATHTYPPLAKFSSRFGILEAAEKPLLPVTVRNIEADIKNRLLNVADDAETGGPGATTAAKRGETTGKPAKGALGQELRARFHRAAGDEQVIEWLGRVAAAKRETSIFRGNGEKAVSLPKPGGKKAFEVMGIPLATTGFHVVEIESRILGDRLLEKKTPMYVPAAALVTNLAAHFKWGRESSAVWVTSLDRGAPAKNVNVTIRDCKGKALWSGKTDQRGVALVKKALPAEEDLPVCHVEANYGEASRALGSIDRGLFVFARTSRDMTFTHSSWDEGIEPWRFQLPSAYGADENAAIAHTIIDRNLLRTGEIVHMKHILRAHTAKGFDLVRKGNRPEELVIEHEGSGQEYRLPLVWQDGGTAENTWKVPEGAKLGTYSLTLGPGKEDANKPHHGRNGRSYPSGNLHVEEFRVPLMKGVIQPPATPLVRAKEVPLDLSVQYLSGGGAAELPVRLRASIQERIVAFPDYDDFTFSGIPLQEGIEKRGDGENEENPSPNPAGPANFPKIPTQELKLDAAGVLRTKVSGIPAGSVPFNVHMEMEFRDPNGEVKTASATIPVYPAGRLVGIKPDSWTVSKDRLKYQVVVVDLKGRPVADAPVAVDLYQEKVNSYRVRLVGGFYAYRNTKEIKKIGAHFQGKTDGRGLLLCEAPSPVSGSVILQARVADGDGNATIANQSMWVAGQDDWWFEARNDDRIDVLPEKKRYEPGDTARFQVRMPFRAATALISVEREGIVDYFVQKLSGKMPVVEVPIKKHYAPNVFVSVLAVRGRIGGTKPTATFDPGRPAYKIGIGEIQVSWRGHELKVQVTPDRGVYRMREEMDVRVRVRTADGGAPPAKSEVAVLAVDEGLLQLLPNDSWELLPAMMQRRSYEVRTATAQAMVVGKRHFGLKALPHGGGGGRQTTRELFDTLLFWKGRAVLDKNGETSVKIPLNDSLTGFRIVAVATGAAGLFGTGEASVRTTQDLVLLPGLPKVVREGDQFQAGVTVRNASDRNMDVELSFSATGRSALPDDLRRERIPAGTAREVYWPVRVPLDTDRIDYEIGAKETGGAADRVRFSQKVIAAVPVRTFQATLAQVQKELKIDIQKPGDALPGRGGIAVRLTPSLTGSLDGVHEYMSQYPYSCLEQKTSVAVALSSQTRWQSIAEALPNYLDSDGLLKYFPTMPQGSDVLTAYVLSVTNEAGYVIPDHLRTRMLEGLTNFLSGRIVRSGSLQTADLAIRKIAAAEALSRHDRLKAEQLASIPIDPNLWPTSAVIDWIGILTRTKDVSDRTHKLQQAEQILRARMNLQGTTLGFSTESMDSLWWLMASADANAVRSILALLPSHAWKADLPRLTTGALQRMKRGHWDTTVANAWGVLALSKFAHTFETAKVAGTATASVGKEAKTLEWAKAAGGKTLQFHWPKAKGTLRIGQEGAGAPWAVVRSLAAIPLKTSFSSGYTVKKTLTPVEQKVKGQWSRGDIVRVRLDLSSQSDMTWVVVNDPVPAGASILRADMGGSALLTAKETRTGQVWEAFTERSFDAIRVYYEYVPKGKWGFEYTLRLNNEGAFNLPASRVEALYAPEMFGETPNHPFEVKAEAR